MSICLSKKTKDLLEELENLLQCDICHQCFTNPYTLGDCDHFFCKSCASPYIGNHCPLCNVPSFARDAHLDSRLQAISSHYKDLKTLLSFPDKKDDKSTNVVVDKTDLNVQPDSLWSSKKITFAKEVEEEKTDEAGVYDFIPTPPGRQIVKLRIPKLSKRRQITVNNKKWKVGEYNCLEENSIVLSDSKDTTFENKSRTSKNSKSVKINYLPLPSECKDYAATNSSVESELNISENKKKEHHISSDFDLRSSDENTDNQNKDVEREKHDIKKPMDISRIQHCLKDNSKNTLQCFTPSRINKRNAKGETALHVAVIKGDFETAQTLLQNGADPNTKDNAGWTPLHEACNHGYRNLVVLLLGNNAFINTPGLDNETPLHDAVLNNHVEIVQILLSRGADPYIRNIHGLTPFDYSKTREMNEALGTPVLPSPKPVNHLKKQYKKIVIMSTGLSKEQKLKLDNCARILNGSLSLSMETNNSCTHLVAESRDDACPRTIKYMQAILLGMWIVKFEWVEACLSAGSHVNEEDFEVKGSNSNPCSYAPEKGRNNVQMQLPGLFNGCNIYFYGKMQNPVPSREELIRLVKIGGGTVLTREPTLTSIEGCSSIAPYHAKPNGELSICSHYILYQVDEPAIKYNHKRLKTLPAIWILESIATFTLYEFWENLNKEKDG